MSPRESGFGKPKWKREPRGIAASSAAPELSQQTPEPFCADNSEPSDGWQSRPGADVGLTELGGDWRKRRKGGFHKHDVPRLVLSERQWRRVARFLTGKRGDPGRTAEDNRRTLEGIIWIFRTGAPWQDLPAYFGKWNSVYRAFKRWCDRGIFLQLFLSLAKERDLRVVMVDGTFIKVHQHGTRARRGGRDAEGSRKMQAIGLTKGGLNTKLMALVDRNGRLVRFSLVPGNAFEAHQLASLLEGLPVKEIHELLGDKAYDTNAVREMLAEMGITVTIPSTSRRKEPIPHDVWSYKGRHLVKNLFGDIKHFRGISTRFCKYSSTFCAGLHLVTWHLRSRGRKGRSSEYLEGR